jgi:hypothetical protein
MTELHSLPTTSPLHVQADKESRLAALGLSEQLLEDGMRFAAAEMDRCSGNDVVSAEGNAGYGKPMRFLRDRLRPAGWTKGGPPIGLESVINPDRTFQIVISSATPATGRENQMPATKYPKGRQTAEAIEDPNQLVLDLVTFTREPKLDLKTLFWLYCLDKKNNEIRHELSIPTHMSIAPMAKRGRIDEFGSRIILSPISLDLDSILEEVREDDFSEDLDIPVVRRTLSE